MKEKLRVAVIGAGYIGRINTEAMTKLGDVEVVAVCNHHIEKAEALIKELGLSARAYADWNGMLDNEKPDAAGIFLPHHLHKQCFFDCCERGVDVIIEKALANTYADCVEMIEAAQRAGIRATVCQTQRYGAVYCTARDYIALHHDELGKLLHIADGLHVHYFWDGRKDWMLDNACSGGGLAMNYGVHQLDRIHTFCDGKTVTFTGRVEAEKPGYTIPSGYSMLGRTSDGVTYTATCTGYSGPSVNETRLIYENAIIECSLCGNGFMDEGVFVGSTATKRFEPIPLTYAADAMYVRQFRAAVDYLLCKTEVSPVPLTWAAEMVRLTELALKISGFVEMPHGA